MMSEHTYSYSYLTQATFRPAVEWHFFKLRAIPCSNECQQVEEQSLEIWPQSQICTSVDGQGNQLQWGSIDYPHTELRILSEGRVRQVAPYCLHEAPAPFYRAETRLTTCSEAMRHFAQSLLPPAAEALPNDAPPAQAIAPFALAQAVMHAVHQHVAYTPAHTTTSTTAREVFLGQKGVCQDLAHLMIALCRALGLHARYANGLIAGEGQTHAWVEVSDGHMWLPFDPTHDTQPAWGYIKIAHGRDADDCPNNRGRFYGWTSEQLTVMCRVF